MANVNPFKAIGKGLERLYKRTPGIPSSFKQELNDLLLGADPQALTYSPYSQKQQAGIEGILESGLGNLGKQQLDFGPIAERARSQFEQRTLPSISERFTSLGGQRSSAFGQQLGAAGADLESQLAALESQYGLESGRLLQSLLALGLTPTTASAAGGIGGSQGLLSALPALQTLLG